MGKAVLKAWFHAEKSKALHIRYQWKVDTNDPPSLVDQYEMMHAIGFFEGGSLLEYKDAIRLFYNKIGGGSVLDYGCGKARGWNEMKRELEYPLLSLYDPGFEPYKNKPDTKSDLVICTDVLEHIPEDELPDLIREIASFANKGVFFGVSTRESKKPLPDGRNAHLTVRSVTWWETFIYDLEIGVQWELNCDNGKN